VKRRNESGRLTGGAATAVDDRQPSPFAASTPRTYVTSGRLTRKRTVLLYAQDNRGLGHINRTLTIARHILAAHPILVAYIVTKSPIAGGFTLHERCDYIKLPTRLTPRAIPQTEDEEEEARRHFRALRSQILQDAAQGLSPDLVLVDHEPLGSKGEFREGLYALKAACPATRFVFGMRDIMDDADRVRTAWQELGVYAAFENLYDGIAVYGSRELYDVAEAYAIPASVRAKLHYCGYIVRDLPAVDRALLRRKYGLPRSGPLILAAVGSGSDGYPVLAAARAAVRLLQARFTDLSMILVAGPFMSAHERATLEAGATSTCRVSAEADTFQLMAAADAIVSMGGYNSVCEALACARPLVIVPRVTHKIEQKIRAEVLAAHGLARWIHPKELSGTSLAAALEWALHRDRRAYARAVREIIPSFDGAARLTAYLSRWLDSS
jgi:predicted glycosyltransferase